MQLFARSLAACAGAVLAAALILGATPASAKTHRDATAGHYRQHKHNLVQPKKTRKPTAAVQDARKLFAAKKLPAAMTPNSYGRYDLGCVAGAVGLPADGPHWQVMRLSRNRAWGRQQLVDYLKSYSDRAH